MQQLACRGKIAVKLVDQYPLYELGGALRGLRDVSRLELDDPFVQLYELWAGGRKLSEVLASDMPLDFCRKSALELLSEIREREQELSKPGAETKALLPWQFGALRKKIEVFENQLSGELHKSPTYTLEDVGIFNLELLAEFGERHIHESIRAAMPPFAVNEFKTAGRCLAFGLFSASGFHSVRAVESVLHVYYEKFRGPPPDKPMGLLASHLNDLLTAEGVMLRPRENTVRYIRDITNFDRNPLIHRGVELEEIDATTLFNSALGVIVEMMKEMASLGEHQPSLLPIPKAKTKKRKPTVSSPSSEQLIS